VISSSGLLNTPVNILVNLPVLTSINLISLWVANTISYLSGFSSTEIGYWSSFLWIKGSLNLMKLTLLPIKQSLEWSIISSSLEMIVLRPNSIVYVHLRSLISQTLITPQSSADITIGDSSIHVIAVIIDPCPFNCPSILSWYYQIKSNHYILDLYWIYWSGFHTQMSTIPNSFWNILSAKSLLSLSNLSLKYIVYSWYSKSKLIYPKNQLHIIS